MKSSMVRKITFCDVDYTVLDFNHRAGVDELRKVSGKSTGLADEFDAVFTLMLGGVRDGGELFAREKKEFAELADVVVEGDHPLPDPHWSRELWAYRWMGDLAYSQGAIEYADIYWKGVAAASRMYDDAYKLLQRFRLHIRDIELVLVTSSDGRLTMLNQEKFLYDPQYATDKKWERLVAATLGHFIDLSRNLIVGDPISKPDPLFWKCAYEARMVGPRDKVFIVGDSYQSDISGAPFGATTILLDRQNRYTDRKSIPPAHHVVHDLGAAMQIIESA